MVKAVRQLARSLFCSGKEKFECPICRYLGPFRGVNPPSGFRKHAQCPQCGSLERHRLQFLVLEEVLRDPDRANSRVLHVAPESFFNDLFQKTFSHRETADLFMEGVDFHVDLTALPFANGQYDLVWASHVLEHIVEDRKAIHEVRRVLMPGGIAVLPVPIVAETTIEYPEPNPKEAFHVRAPGYDYFDRLKESFSRVDLYSSEHFPEQYQVFIYENREDWPTVDCPLRKPMKGERHQDVVPVCHV